MLQLIRLVVNPTKTYVVYEEIEYLGYKITGDTIRISDSKIKAIRDLPTKKTANLYNVYKVFYSISDVTFKIFHSTQ